MSSNRNNEPGICILSSQAADTEFAQVLSNTFNHQSVQVHWRDFSISDASFQGSISKFANQVLTAEFESIVFVTGAGTDHMIETCCKTVDRQRLLDCLTDGSTIAGSYAAFDALKANGITPDYSIVDATKQGTRWREILILLDQSVRIANQTIALEESGDIFSLSNGLEARGARVEKFSPFPVGQPAEPDNVKIFFEQLDAGYWQAILFADAEAAAQFVYLGQQIWKRELPSHLLDNHVVLTLNQQAKEILLDRRMSVDYSASLSNAKDLNQIESTAHKLSEQIGSIQKQKAIIRVNISGPATSTADPNAPWYESPFMKACRGEPTDVTPIWMMRQAGRYMAEYREVRSKVSFLDLCYNPQLCSEVMCTAVNKLGVDAAIIFSDLLPILEPLGCDLEFVKGGGPVIHNPVRTTKDLDRIKPLESNDSLQFVMDTVRQTRNDLPADMPLIGFAGAPFTLASYMIEGGSSRNYENTKKLMFSDAAGWNHIMDLLSNAISIYINGQIEAGAQCIQLFDSWAGCLSFEHYRQYVHPYVKKIIATVPSSVPVINFATGNPALLPLLADTQASVVGIDWRLRLDDAWDTVGHDRAVQGNLDPTVLLTDPEEIKRQAKVILQQANGRPGHIFNLGHGILPMTPVDNAIALVDAVHELSSQ
ncbi:MAG: uroporphyrinogen decarboxylase [Planctomycetota bacterium]